MRITIEVDVESGDYDAEGLWESIASEIAGILPESYGDNVPTFTIEWTTDKGIEK